MIIQPTVLTYATDGHLLTGTALVSGVLELETGQVALLLDRTILYPQGGGQPYDQGTIQSSDGSALFRVDEVRLKEGIVHHLGTIVTGTFTVGDTVTIYVAQERRLLNSRYHTAGHIIDCALHSVGLQLQPTRGYHFPEGAYVEYCGTMGETERSDLVIQLQEEVTKLIEQALPITIKTVSLEELATMIPCIPDYLPLDKPARVMIVEGYPAIPCGGTHVENTKDVIHMVIEKMTNKKGNMRVSYACPPNIV